MFDLGVRTAVQTAVYATPWLVGAVGFTVAFDERVADLDWRTRAVMGALTGALLSTGWEFTVNAEHEPAVKKGVIGGCTAIGTACGVILPAAMR